MTHPKHNPPPQERERRNEQIRWLHKAGITQGNIAKRFRISPVRVSQILKQSQ